jgi:hypothetical protein
VVADPSKLPVFVLCGRKRLTMEGYLEELPGGSARSFDFRNADQDIPGTGYSSQLVRDLLRSLRDHVETGSLTDVHLVSPGGRKVPANRFVLAARSPVFAKMLYGGFREASSDRVELDYDARLLEVIVHYCNTETVPISSVLHGSSNIDDVDEAQMRFLVDLARAADYFQLLGLQVFVTRRIRYFMTRNLSLAIAVFDQADASSELYGAALQVLETRPYAVFGEALGSRGTAIGIECLSQGKIVSFFKSSSIAAGELFLFHLLQQWHEHHRQSPSTESSELAITAKKEVKVLETALQCCRHIQLVNIEPSVLLDTVSSCPFCPPEMVFSAIAQQALQASQRGVWALSCRGGKKSSSVERLLVEDCGMRDAQGIYYRVMGLAQGVGGLYTKREASSGQEWVYTLSCAVKANSYDCRLFRSKLLTQGAVATLARMQRSVSVVSSAGPHSVFQPVLQLASTKSAWHDLSSSCALCGDPEPRGTNVGNSSRLQKYTRVQLSDGEHFMVATLSKTVAQALDDTLFAVVKVLEYSLYCMDEQILLHVTKISVLHSNLGQCFGSAQPLRAETVQDVRSEEDPDAGPAVLQQNPVQLLYTCSTPIQATRDRNAPCSRYGWIAHDDLIGTELENPPSVMWIPVVDGSGPRTTSHDVASSTTSSVDQISSHATDCEAHATSVLIGM